MEECALEGEPWRLGKEDSCGEPCPHKRAGAAGELTGG